MQERGRGASLGSLRSLTARVVDPDGEAHVRYVVSRDVQALVVGDVGVHRVLGAAGVLRERHGLAGGGVGVLEHRYLCGKKMGKKM